MKNTLPFVKATACGNDFILIEGRLADSKDWADLTRKICDRYRGVGADGVEWLLPADGADIRARLINADGSPAEISGNGTRCVASWMVEQTNKSEIRILTDAGTKTCTLTERYGNTFEFRTDMGEAKVDDELPVRLARESVLGIPVSMGNPHYVQFVDEFLPGWQAKAAEIGVHRDFKDGTNVELVKVSGPNEIEIRIFERGAGETQSSGTGSCASAVATIFTKRAQSPLRVVSPGGPQTVEWNGRVVLTGPAQILCRGEFFL